MSSIETPASARWAQEARKGRRRLYPTTFVYGALTIVAITFGLRTSPRATAISWALGVAFWTWLEYMVHRYILHGEFADGPGHKHLLHILFGHLHWEHHARPWDANHINGTIKDTAPFILPMTVPAFFFPAQTYLAFLAGVIQAYVVEEWVHHSVHFYHFKNIYFRYIQAHHRYHHSQRGQDIAFGLTSGMWDAAYQTRISPDVRHALYRHLLHKRRTA